MRFGYHFFVALLGLGLVTWCVDVGRAQESAPAEEPPAADTDGPIENAVADGPGRQAFDEVFTNWKQLLEELREVTPLPVA